MLVGKTVKIVPAKFHGDLRLITDLVVIHSAETSERPSSAENIAAWFAKPWDGKKWIKASAHYAVDCDSIVECVPEKMVAWHARGVNDRAIGVELAGRAAQTREEWLDDYGRKMLDLARELVFATCRNYHLPAQYVSAAEIRSGKKGVTTHAQVTIAYKIKGGHTDPGPGFPMDYLIGGN